MPKLDQLKVKKAPCGSKTAVKAVAVSSSQGKIIAAAADVRLMCEKQQAAGVQTASELHPSRVDNNITMGAAI